MWDIESKLWRVRYLNEAYRNVTQKASGVTKQVMTGDVPSWEELAAMHERRFDAACRDAFHGDTE